jgi:lipopolysaccharide/colanic/teichoic acid biosynthesis glycosyltransferase
VFKGIKTEGVTKINLRGFDFAARRHNNTIYEAAADAGELMKLIQAGNISKQRQREGHMHPGRFADRLLEAGHTFLAEEAFRSILRLERKRTERSAKPFVLMLLNIEEIVGLEGKEALLLETASSLFSAAREVDIKGWYEHEGIMGIIFAEINGVHEKVTSKIFTKVYQALCRHLGVEMANRVKISMHIFPESEEESTGKNGGAFDPNLYPDLSPGQSSKKFPLLLKRVVDVVGSLLALAILSPLLMMIAVFIKLASRGPVLFRQERVGLFGKRFTFLKFRSMYVDSDQAKHKEYVTKFITESRNGGEGESDLAQNGVYKLTNDSRITPVGRFLRKTSFDELPQFFNVLMGDMSLVGPRPPIPYECENYDVWHKRRILEVKPGITGLWQVRGRSSTTFDEMVRLDLNYVRHWSLILDLKILIQTPFAVFKGKGAY